MHKKIVLFAMVATFLVMGGVVIAQDRPPQSTNQDVLPGNSTKGDTPQVLSDQDLQLFRKDVRSLKKQIVAANMDLTDAQAEKFCSAGSSDIHSAGRHKIWPPRPGRLLNLA